MRTPRPGSPGSPVRRLHTSANAGAGLVAELEALIAPLVEAAVAAGLEAAGTGGDAWLGVREAARHIGYAEGELERGARRVYDLKARGVIRAHADGSRLVFRRSELDRYLEDSVDR